MRPGRVCTVAFNRLLQAGSRSLKLVLASPAMRALMNQMNKHGIHRTSQLLDYVRSGYHVCPGGGAQRRYCAGLMSGHSAGIKTGDRQQCRASMERAGTPLPWCGCFSSLSGPGTTPYRLPVPVARIVVVGRYGCPLSGGARHQNRNCFPCGKAPECNTQSCSRCGERWATTRVTVGRSISQPLCAILHGELVKRVGDPRNKLRRES